MRTQAQPSILWNDKWLLLAVIALLSIGLLMVASASMVISDRVYGFPFHFLLRQATFMGIGIVMALIVTRIPMSFWQRMSRPALLVGLVLLVLVLIPGIGKVVNGSRRWINIGFAGFQASEVMKLAMILYLSGYLVHHAESIQSQTSGFLRPMLIVVVTAGLLMLEPDFGATTVIMMTAMTMMFLGGVRLRYFVVLILLAAGAMALLAVTSPYRMQRLTTFMHPWANPYGSGYQLTQSLIAFGRGGITGVGLGNSIQKLFYLPEAHTDFLFAVLAEELGLLGELTVIGLFMILVGRMMFIGRRAIRVGEEFSGYVVYGIAVWFGLQAMINIGVNAGLLPTKGLTLPLMSYGGTSILVSCIALGMVIRVAYETRQTSSSYVPVRTRRVRA